MVFMSCIRFMKTLGTNEFGKFFLAACLVNLIPVTVFRDPNGMKSGLKSELPFCKMSLS